MYMTSITGGSMGNNLSLCSSEVEITPKLKIRVPTVGEVLDQEDAYFTLISVLTSSPFQFMVQLDDMGIDYSSITHYEMFLIFFPSLTNSDLSILFGDINTSDFQVYHDRDNDIVKLYSPSQDITIDECIYNQLATVLRKMNHLKMDRRKPGNEEAKEYLLDRERKRLKRLERRKKRQDYSESEFEKLVVALVNQDNFKYDYKSVRDLSIYNFYQSFKQIQTKINFDNTMRGVYAGTIDTSKLQDKSCLSWIPTK